MDLFLLQELQEIEEKELENKIRADKALEAEAAARNASKRDLINRADSIGNSERRR